MAKIKEITRVAKLEFLAGKAKPGPELAGLGIVMPEFTKQFNDQTRDRGDEPVPVTITVYKDRSFTFKTHTAPAAYMLKKAAKIDKGAANSKTDKVATITQKQLQEIAEYKLPDMNTRNVEAAMNSIAGTAKNMGILIEGRDDLQKAKEEAAQAAKDQILAQAKEDELSAAAEAAVENKDQPIEVNAIAQKDVDQEEDKGGK